MTNSEEDRKLLIFLSHASEDKRHVRNLCNRLKEDGFDPWLDEERLLPGQDWNLEIEKALRASDAILLCFSSKSVFKEGYIQREYKRAMRYLEEKPEGTIYVIPIRLDKCELPHFIREIQWVDYPADYDRLVMSLGQRAGSPAKSMKPAQPKAKKLTTPRPKGGNVFNFQGEVHIAGNMIGGAQTNYSYNQQHTYNITSPSQFMDELQKLKAEIERLKTLPDVDRSIARRMDVVQADIEEALDEAAKERPAAERINKTLDGAKETIEKLESSVGTAMKLGTTLGQLAMIAMRLFGS